MAESMERPAHRATAFVPRLGKREVDFEGGARALCASYGIDCDSIGYANQQRDRPQLVSLILKTIQNQNNLQQRTAAAELAAARQAAYEQSVEVLNQEQPSYLDLMEVLMAQQLRRQTRSIDAGQRQVEAGNGGANGSGAKRVAFTPRIG